MSPRRVVALPHPDFGENIPPAAASLAAGPHTEAAFAKRLAIAHRDELRYDYPRGRWVVWREHRWAPDVDGAVVRLALRTISLWQRQALDHPDIRTRGELLRELFGLERGAKLGAVLALTRAVEPIADSSPWDVDPWLLGVLNGVVDLRTGERRDGRPEDRITMQAAVGFDSEARCPRWERAIREWFPDPDLADFVWRAAGYSITGVTTEQVLFAGHAGGANGKSTFLRGIAGALGDYSYNMPFSVLEFFTRAAIPNDLAALAGRRFVLASETNDGTRLNEARVKSLTGGDACTARFLHGEFFTFSPVLKLWLAFNHRPIVRDDSFAFWRRVRLVPFVCTFNPDPTLGDVLRDEAPGILAWLVRGCVAWQEVGLAAPSIVTEATGDYRRDSDHFGRFLEEATEVDDSAEVAALELFRHYETWAERQGFALRDRMTNTMFGRKCSERLRRVRTKSGNVYVGLARRASL